MSESLLKKEFKKEDVNRLRNIIRKDYSKKTKISSGYSKADQTHQEGEIWEESGRKWTIENGLKKSISKLDSIKDIARIPLACPSCGGSMSGRLDKKMYKIHGFCFDCTIEYEHQLKKAGLYEEYEKSMMQGALKAFAKDLEQWILERVSFEESSFVTEQGDVEDWGRSKKANKSEILDALKEFSNHTKSFLSK